MAADHQLLVQGEPETVEVTRVVEVEVRKARPKRLK